MTSNHFELNSSRSRDTRDPTQYINVSGWREMRWSTVAQPKPHHHGCRNLGKLWQGVYKDLSNSTEYRAIFVVITQVSCCETAGRSDVAASLLRRSNAMGNTTCSTYTFCYVGGNQWTSEEFRIQLARKLSFSAEVIITTAGDLRRLRGFVRYIEGRCHTSWCLGVRSVLVVDMRYFFWIF